MGNTLDNLTIRQGVKRRRTEESSPVNVPEQRCDHPSLEHTPKRKRTQSTAKYIIQKLFEEGQGSDVTIIACGREWHLHKLYLCQCKYFESMFNGPWIESKQSTIHMEIADENITAEALKVVFQSLYTDNVFVKSSQAVGVVAAATLLQLDPMIDHSTTVMLSAIGQDTVCRFYMAAERYGLVEVKNQCLAWLQHCLMVPNFATLLCHISETLLLSILSSPELWMMQVEVDVYSVLKKWMFVQLNPTWNGNREQLYKDTEEFFRSKGQGSDVCFLEKPEGHRFIHIFEHVRWAYVVSDLSSIQLLKDDKIVPLSWLDSFIKFNWYHHLQVEQAVDEGPRDVSEEQFLKKSMRCGRILLQEQDYCWRWVGYNFGLDLLIMCRNRVISVKRNGGCQSFEGSISQQQQRHIMVRVSVAPMRKKDAIRTSGVRSLVLGPREELTLLQIGSSTHFPLQVTMNLLFFSPSPDIPTPSLAIPPVLVALNQPAHAVTEDMSHAESNGGLSDVLETQLGLSEPCSSDGFPVAGLLVCSRKESACMSLRREDSKNAVTRALELENKMCGQFVREMASETDISSPVIKPFNNKNEACQSSQSLDSSQLAGQPCPHSVSANSSPLLAASPPKANVTRCCLSLSSPVLNVSDQNQDAVLAVEDQQLCSECSSGRETAGDFSIHSHRCQSQAACSRDSVFQTSVLKVQARPSVHQKQS